MFLSPFIHFFGDSPLGTVPRGLSPKGKWEGGACLGRMEKTPSIISEWLGKKSKQERIDILTAMGSEFGPTATLPIEGVLEQLAARILTACAEELGLSTVELSGLLHAPRKDALAGLITVVRGDE